MTQAKKAATATTTAGWPPLTFSSSTCQGADIGGILCGAHLASPRRDGTHSVTWRIWRTTFRDLIAVTGCSI